MSADEKRDLKGYADAVHHLAWLACDDNQVVTAETEDVYDALSETAERCSFDAPSEDGAHYIGPALDLLWLAYADCEGTPRAKAIEKAIELLEQVRHG